MTQEDSTRLRLDPEDNNDHDAVDLQSVQEVKVQGERLLEESRSLTRSSRALLEEIDPRPSSRFSAQP